MVRVGSQQVASKPWSSPCQTPWPADVLKLLPCRHAYHAECLGTWLDVSKACPDCRREVEVGAQHPAPSESS
jgi:hypothetical protein